MQTRQTAESRVTYQLIQDPSQLAGPIDRIAAMFAEISGELGRFSEQLRAQRDATEASQRQRSDTSGPSSPAGSVPPPVPQGPDLRGEPVDTSFARPAQAPAADAAGAAPYPDERA